MSSSVLNKKGENVVSHSDNGTPYPPDEDDGNGNDGNGNRDESNELEKLRKLIVDSEGVGEALPAAVTNKAKKDSQLAKATLPLVEENIRQSVAQNPKILAEALFPAIGPAIRRAISQALNSMVQSFNQTLEYSVSPKGLGWRLEALRTGKSFGEIVMLKTLLYRVEQIFLIHKETGLLLQHVTADRKNTQDADMVSAMLTAIEDFVEDSFTTPDGATLDSLKMKGFTVWIEHSPDALIAGVIRGNPPLALRETFSETIEEIQYKYETELNNFEGDPEAFEDARLILKRCLQFQANEKNQKTSGFLKPLNITVAIFGTLLLLGVAYFSWQYWLWSGYVKQLKAEPGIVVAESDFGFLSHSITGMRDPLSRQPGEIRKEFGFEENDIDETWRLYNDGDAAFVIPRAKRLLKPPDNVEFTFENGVLSANGNAPTAWFAEAQKLALALVGVKEFKTADDDLIKLRAQIEAHAILFNCNTIDYVSDQKDEFTSLVKEIEEIIDLGGKLNIQIRGHATEPGTDGANENISRLRAEKVYDEIFSRSLKLEQNLAKDPKSITIVALGESQRDTDCKVSFKVNFR